MTQAGSVGQLTLTSVEHFMSQSAAEPDPRLGKGIHQGIGPFGIETPFGGTATIGCLGSPPPEVNYATVQFCCSRDSYAIHDYYIHYSSVLGTSDVVGSLKPIMLRPEVTL